MLNHIFRIDLSGKADSLFDNCVTLDDYLRNLDRLSRGATTEYFIENGFQALVEAIIVYNDIIKGCKFLPKSEQDWFVHAQGKNEFGNNATVMVVYSQDPVSALTANKDHLTSFFANSRHHGFDVSDKNDKVLFIFSNAQKIHDITYQDRIVEPRREKAVVLYMGDDIRKLVDGNNAFWEFFRASMGVSFTEPKVKELRWFQKDALSRSKKSNKGMVILPTGTGKSLIEAGVIQQAIEDYDGGEIPVCMIVSPRIVLTYQLINMVSSYLSGNKRSATYFNLNSGRMDDADIKKKMQAAGLSPTSIESSTSSIELANAYNKCMKNKSPLIIGATYHSAFRVNHANINHANKDAEFAGIPITLLLCDEAHNLVMGRFSNKCKEEAIHKIQAKKKYFYTATPAFSPSPYGCGMNNSGNFGPVIYVKSPRQMIEAGEILPPFIHRVYIDEFVIKASKDALPAAGDIEDNVHNIELAAHVVIEAFNKHREKVKEYSSEPDEIGAKLLVVCKGEPSFKGFLHENNSKVMKAFRIAHPEINFLGISSASGSFINGVWKRDGNYKEPFMLELQGMPDNQDAIIFHIDMLGEGVDVPGITGVMAFRDLGEIRSSQTLGRAMRLCKVDRERFYQLKIKPLESVENFDDGTLRKSSWIKPLAWVVIPCYSWDHEDMDARIITIATKMNEDLGYVPFENSSGATGNGKHVDFVVDEKGDKGRVPDMIKIRHLVEAPKFRRATDLVIEAILQGDEIVRKMLIAHMQGDETSLQKAKAKKLFVDVLSDVDIQKQLKGRVKLVSIETE